MNDYKEAKLRKSMAVMRRPMLPSLLWLISGLVCLWLGGLIYFANSLPQAVEDPDGITDAIVVLTGGAERLDVGLALLVQDRAQRLLISGVDRATTAEALRAQSPTTPERFACCVDLGHEAVDTVGNAVETAMWVKSAGYRSLRVVTASYHMPRSLLLFRHYMPDVELVANPVFPAHVKLTRWWLWPGTAKLLAVEFNKYLVSLLRVQAGPGLAGNGNT